MADTHLISDGNGPVPEPANGGPHLDAPPASGPLEALLTEMDEVMYSDIGLTTLLDRLKQSIASARDFAAFLKKRSVMEDDHQKSMKRLIKSTEEALHHAESRQGSYKRQLDEALKTHSKMANNTNSFALSLGQMHEDLTQLTNNMERGRKEWKHEGLNAEKKASDAEALMNRAKTKYDSLADDYDRAKTGDVKGKAKFIKGPKSAAQYEEDVLRKLQAADTDYQEKVQLAKAQRDELVKSMRPRAVKAIMELIRECDSALAMQLQKYATFTEKLLIGNGVLITPLPNEGAHHSLRDIMANVNNDTDFQNYIISHKPKVPVRNSGIEYIKHPTLAPKTQNAAPSSRQPSANHPPQPPVSQPETTYAPPPQDDRTYSFKQPAPTLAAPYSQGPPQVPPQDFSHSREPSGSMQYPPGPPGPQYNEPPYPTGGPPVDMGGPPQGPPSQVPFHGGPPSHSNSPMGGPVGAPPPSNNLPPPTRPVFGVDLEELFARDGSAVPMVVYQCMQAVDLFGLSVEGIYRQNGTAQHIQSLKAQFDNDASRVDFRNPANFHHDVNSVAGLLKQFFRDLPDPLLTKDRYGEFISAARIDDDVVRRDTLHAIINGMPDANYATLRALVLHLTRVQENQGQNRMSSSNLAICFAPSLMGVSGGAQIQDSALQARVIDTILINTYSIFDED
ncbi:putative RHO GTPase-activating protein RGD1 [Elsinoe australis]|uniref:Putative RHO GTPase-activating protein RGD1 n=1 Tax=Elsinoe australis TaxID=40998 RepID=A0A4U7AWZ4_9PEZI|nr:putative RHO GTPase-activating protein RGD1 [Elsinoe australis]